MVDTSDRAALLEAALASLSEGVTITDALGGLHYANDAAARLLGAGDDVFDELGAPFDLAQLVTSGRTSEVTIRIRTRATGEERWARVTSKPIPGQERAVNTFRDITTLKQRERETEGLKQELVELVTERDARARFLEHFISVVGHDLRSPLSAIIMATALLGKAPLEERAARALLRIQTSSKRAERLIKDLVDFARARLGSGIPLQRTDVDLRMVAEQIIEELSLSSGDRKVTLSLSGDPCGHWDGERMGQVMANLVGNALKYSPVNTEVRVEIRADDHEARLVVHNDGGSPMSPEVLARLIVDPFSFPEGSAGKSDGLGLSIVAEIVRAHGGRLEARSSKEEGTTLIAHLPR